MDYTELTDEDLMAHFRKTLDEEVFRVLAERLYPLSLHIARERLGDADQAQDAVQEALIRVVRHHRRYKPGRAFKPWFQTILRNTCTDMHRKRARHAEALERYSAEPRPHHTPPATTTRFTDLTTPLPIAERRLLDLRFRQGLDLHEIAEQLNCSLEAAKKRVQRAVKRLRNQLALSPVDAPERIGIGEMK